MKPVIPFLILCFYLFSCNNGKRTPSEVIADYYQHGKLNGAVLMAKNDSIICDTVVGYSNFYTKQPLKKQTAFYIASLSKSFTAVAIQLLQQQHRLSYDDKVSRYVDSLPEYAQPITIKQLLNHISGIKDYEAVLSDKKGLTNDDVIKWLHQQTTLQFQPGTKFEYSNSGYILLSLVIENISKKSYKQFLQDNIFTPLAMHNTTVYDQTMQLIPDKAIGFDKDKIKDDYSILTTGDGGIFSTVEDLYKFDSALRNNILLPGNSTSPMYQLPVLQDGKLSEYGFGWFIENTNGNKIAKHTGGLNGFRSVFWRDLTNNTTIIVLTNQGDAIQINSFLDDLKSTVLPN